MPLSVCSTHTQFILFLITHMCISVCVFTCLYMPMLARRGRLIFLELQLQAVVSHPYISCIHFINVKNHIKRMLWAGPQN